MADLVSIIMPAYNCEKYIAQSIASVIAQTYNNWELIVIDDCSTDNTIDIIKSFNDDRICFQKNKSNVGAAITRNKAISLAKGEWIAFLDSDDLWEPSKLEEQIAFMKEHGYAFTYTDYRIQLNGEWLPYIVTGPNIVTKRKLYNYNYMSTITIMYNANSVGKIEVANLKKGNDYAMWLQVINKENCYRLPKCLSYYIKHDNSLSSGNKVRLISRHYKIFRIALKKGVFTSILLTANNLFHGFIKRYKYRKPIISSNSSF